VIQRQGAAVGMIGGEATLMVDGSYYRLWTPTWCDYEVRIDLRAKAFFRTLFPRNWSGDRTEITADIALLSQPVGPHGALSVAAQLQGQTLGYLDLETATAWTGVVRRVVASGCTPVTLGRVVGTLYDDFENNQQRFWVELYLALGEPATALPQNDPPAAPYTMLPKSAVLQVTKEEQYLDALLAILPPDGTGVFFATLHERPSQGRANPVVEVRIDDNCVGQLTPQTSQKFLPLIRHLDSRGLATACWSDVKGSKVAVEARINAIKANEASAEVLDGPASVIQRLVPPQQVVDPLPPPVPAGIAAGVAAPPPPPVFSEPPDGALIRFTLYGKYQYVAHRQSIFWYTTARYDGGDVGQQTDWSELAPLLTGFDYATATDWVYPHGDYRVLESGAVITFTPRGLPASSASTYAAINIAEDGGWSGDWYTTLPDDTDVWGEPITFSDIAGVTSHVMIVTAWARYGI